MCTVNLNLASNLCEYSYRNSYCDQLKLLLCATSISYVLFHTNTVFAQTILVQQEI